jgi:hypothetical protein
MKRALASTALFLALSACAAQTGSLEVASQQGQNGGAPALTRQHFKDTTTLKDDALETSATLTSINGFQQQRGLLGLVLNDSFLRAFVDKKTGKATYQLYQVLTYRASGWRLYQIANFETPAGPQSKRVTLIGKTMACPRPRSGECSYSEQLVMEVDEALLRAIVENSKDAPGANWKFKFKAKSGDEFADAMSTAEIAGFLARVGEYQNGRLLAQAH